MNSQSWFEKAQAVMPGGVSSPVRAFKHVGRSPIYFERAEGPYLFDVEGNRYIDFCLSFGPHVLGHAAPPVVSAIQKQVGLGTSFGACHPQEVSLIDKLLVSYPFLQKGRLVNSGTEAVMTAIRLARGFTGRSKVIKFEGCYHGHSDGLLAKSGSGLLELSEASSSGVPQSIVQETLIAKLDDLSTVEALFKKYPGQVAALIMEPIPANDGLHIPKHADMVHLAKLVKDHGALLILDEVITGFRLGLGGATAYFDLTPDLITLGKAIGGGLPLAALLGRGDIMGKLAPEGPVYQAGTFSGNILSVAAGIAAIDELTKKRPEWNAFDRRCEAFADKLFSILGELGPIDGRKLGSIFWFQFGNKSEAFPPAIDADQKAKYARFFAGCLEEGVYFAPSPFEVSFVSFSHTQSVLDDALERIKKCVSQL